MDTSNLPYKGTYNDTFNIMDHPLIRFPDQNDYVHREMVFLKCYMICIMENKQMGQTLIQRLQTQLTFGFVGLVCIMLALSSELVWTAYPLMLFCYSCQTLKFFALESSLRRCISLIFNVMCCNEVAGYEFVFDVYFILCYLGMGLYSLYMKKDHNGKDRIRMQRASMLLFFFIEIALLLYSHVVDYKFTILINIILAFTESCIVGAEMMYVSIIYAIMTQFIVASYVSGIDIDAYFDYFIYYVWNYLLQNWNDLLQYSGIV